MSTQADCPPGLATFSVLRRVYLFNLSMTAFGALALRQGYMTPPSDSPLGALNYTVWVLCVMHCGMPSLLLQIWIARRAWRRMPDVNSIYTAQGSFMALPRGTRWQMALGATASVLLLSYVAHRLFLAIQGSAWGLANLSQVQPPYASALSMAICGMAMSIVFEYAWQHVAYQKSRTLEAQKLSAQAQLDLLRSQLDPHLLFNTLSNLYELIDEQPAQARAMLLHLIGFLRSTLLGSRSTEQALSKEFKVVSDYLSLMHIRMGDRLQTRLTVPDELGTTLVPALLLQPLVENAIKHGLEGRKEGGMLAVTAWREAEILMLEVSNTDDGSPRQVSTLPDELQQNNQAPSGFGLQFVRERLRNLYGTRAGVEMRHCPDEELTRVTVWLPASPSPAQS